MRRFRTGRQPPPAQPKLVLPGAGSAAIQFLPYEVSALMRLVVSAVVSGAAARRILWRTRELVHAVDLRQQYSGAAEFGRVASLGISVIRQRDADRANQKRERFNGEGRYEAAWEASRSFGNVFLQGRLPSVQALDSCREAFAECGAHLVVDPNARRRFEPRLLLFSQRATVGAP
jgi:hypothetical protein